MSIGRAAVVGLFSISVASVARDTEAQNQGTVPLKLEFTEELRASERGLAQPSDPARPHSSTAAYVSASGAITYGFALDREGIPADATVDIVAILPGPEISGPARALIERMWRGSPAFRRQCARLADARVAVTIDFHHPQRTDRRRTAARSARS